MLARLAFLFVVVPLLELILLVQLGRWVGLWPTLALVLGTGILGAAMARAEGLRTWLAFQGELAAGRLPGGALLDGIAILVGGAFLLTPGLLTDVAGFALLLPPTRRWIQRGIRRWLEGQLEAGTIRVFTLDGTDLGERDAEEGTAGLDPRHEIPQRSDQDGRRE